MKFQAVLDPNESEMTNYTDEQIVEELQAVGKWFTEHGRNTNTAIIGISERAIAIINRQKSEIERLTTYNANLICANTDITNRHKDYVEEAERIAREDAITEFAERLKEAVKYIPWCDYPPVHNCIDQIAKEMKEVTDES